MNKLRHIGREEKMMGFIASCIESVASELNLPYFEIFERMERVGLIDNYIFPSYDALHTESRENLTLNLINTLEHWEKLEQDERHN